MLTDGPNARAAKALLGEVARRVWAMKREADGYDTLRDLLAIPEDTFIAGTITIGRPEGRHGPVRRRPLRDLVFEEAWDRPADWAVDPPGTGFTSAGPRAGADPGGT